jgi:phosphatidylethanolamine/phosphatidyl-N-methylethanolamine N-methyltransferase
MGLKERLTFLSQLRADFVHTGAIQPSSRFLAAAMTQPLRDASSGNARILEIGPGTGPVTRAIARGMGEQDELECYEINPDFAQYLDRTVREDPLFSGVRDRIRIHNAPAQELEAGEGFDFVVCSAPLNNFNAGTIEDIFRSSFAAMRPGGTFTFFGYMVFPALRGFFARGDTHAKLAEAQAVKNDWISRQAKGSKVVLLNLPPARVHHLEGLSL